MQLKTRTDKIRKILRTIYPDVKTPLNYETPFQLLIATILSAQCTDRQVNRVTEVLFKHLKTPADFAGVPLKTLEKYIHSTGFYHNKAKNIKNCSQEILDTHGGRVPQTMAELVKLPGVGIIVSSLLRYSVTTLLLDTRPVISLRSSGFLQLAGFRQGKC